MKPSESIKIDDSHSVLVSVDTYERLKLRRHRWRMVKGGRYPYVWLGSPMLMHRLIMGAKKGVYVDHINGDPLDNRDENLRFCTSCQNNQNRKPRSQGFKGVSWCKRSRKWRAEIGANRARYFLGFFQHQKRAAMAYDRAALALHGAFASLNFDGRRAAYRPCMPH